MSKRRQKKKSKQPQMMIPLHTAKQREQKAYREGVMAVADHLQSEQFFQAIFDPFNDYAIARSDLMEVFARIDELAQLRKALQNKVLLERLALLSVELSAAGRHLRNVAARLNHAADDEVNAFMAVASDIQDEIEAIFAGESNGDRLAKMHGELPGNLLFADELRELLKRKPRSRDAHVRNIAQRMTNKLRETESITVDNAAAQVSDDLGGLYDAETIKRYYYRVRNDMKS